MVNRGLILTGMLAAMVLLPGCKKAEVDPVRPTVEPHVTVLDSAYVLGPQQTEKTPWWRPLQVVLDTKPADDKELEAKLTELSAEPAKAARQVLEEIRDLIAAKQKPNGKWSLLGVSLGRAKRATDIQFTADVGLTKLFARRPAINFNNVPVEMCIAKLCRETGIQESQPRGHNPPVLWNKTDVSAYEAIDGILATHRFQHKFSDTHYKVALRLQDYSTRAAFIAAATDEIMAKGDALNSARPGLVVTPRERTADDSVPIPDATKK